MFRGAPSSQAIACTTEQTELGEGVRWDTRRGELLRVDILAGRVYRDHVDDDGALHPVRCYQLATSVGAISPIWGDDGWLLAAGTGFVHLAPDGTYRPIAEAIVGPDARFNDAGCDPQGRCWADTIANDHHAGGGALHRLDGDGGVETVLEGLTIPNGLGWSPDGETMYLVDSGPRVVLAFAFDSERGAISAGRILITVPAELGAPDGLALDAAGDLWVAIYGGGCVQHYTPEGVLQEVYSVPARQSTCCALAGRGLHVLYVTTATEGWSDEVRRADPAAGLVYRVDTRARGVPAAPFVPDPVWWETVMGRTT